MPIGKHKGRTLGELAATPAGRSYLRWASGNLSGRARPAAGIVLAGRECGAA
jgi:hypothetical protein